MHAPVSAFAARLGNAFATGQTDRASRSVQMLEYPSWSTPVFHFLHGLQDALCAGCVWLPLMVRGMIPAAAAPLKPGVCAAPLRGCGA